MVAITYFDGTEGRFQSCHLSGQWFPSMSETLTDTKFGYSRSTLATCSGSLVIREMGKPLIA